MAAEQAPKAFAEAVASEDPRTRLEALRDALASDIAEADVRYRAPLYARLESVLAQIGRLPGKQASKRDDLAAEREKRRKAASALDGPKVPNRGRGRGGGSGG